MKYHIKGVIQEVRDVWDPLVEDPPEWIRDNERIEFDTAEDILKIAGDEFGPTKLSKVCVLRDPEDGDIWWIDRELFRSQYEPSIELFNDQKAKADYGKARITLVPTRIIWDIAAIRQYGTEKYGDPDNWKKVSKERYRDALCRHLLAYLEDPESADEESGFSHLWHMACNVAFLCELEDVPVKH